LDVKTILWELNFRLERAEKISEGLGDKDEFVKGRILELKYTIHLLEEAQ